MGVPKRKTSKSRRDKRRTHHRLGLVNPSACPQCGASKLSHRVCVSCGYYKSREITAGREA
ncbi:MAG: 50S ribosomal protein L32 [Candidatus Tectomicrobia bacterium]|uniref:Large ribosomal subunit protein bL32 n=1 Tax=Tectimicrobiota bacterium TaxID=2528274 RepID=A0A938B459_UNCTE|nr:50S ribosomal protein L32 [Candidatus Tectomicrobia bacterium]